MEEVVAGIEGAFVAHWQHFGRYPNARLCEEDGVLWFESPLRHLPYNAVIRTAIPHDVDADEVVGRVVSLFKQRDVPFLWVVLPSDQPRDLGQRLAKQGLDLTEVAIGMDLPLDRWQRSTHASPATIVDVGDDPALLADYEQLIRSYWSVPEADQTLIETLNRHWTGARNPGVRLVAKIAGRAVGKLFLNLTQLPDQVSIYGVAVVPEARGQGVARSLMDEALARAQGVGAGRCVLHSSPMARPMYRGMGFTERCELHVHATAPLFGTHHH